MQSLSVHIVAFDVPYPANYGGVIDVFYKIKNLAQKGVNIYLHCFQYGRAESSELNKYCKKVYYYRRKTGIVSQFSIHPYIVKSRESEILVQNLLKDPFPIVFEGLHTLGIALDNRLSQRYKIFRPANIEHHYYSYLAKAEGQCLKKIYFQIEALKLKFFEKHILKMDLVLAVSESDKQYFRKQYPTLPTYFVPCFHENEDVKSSSGKGNYALYNGNLSVPENIKAVNYLIDHVFAKINYPFIIAGLNPSENLIRKAKPYNHIQIKANLSNTEMRKLIEDAQFHTLITFQPTGLKLKLLNTLYRGRFCITNSAMTTGTNLDGLCLNAETPQEIINYIQSYSSEVFQPSDVLERQSILEKTYNNQIQAEYIVNLLKAKNSH